MPHSAALASLPHGPEFRFVDEVLELEPGQSGTGCYTVRGDEAFLSAHFPGNPLLPGVILIEALAQLGGVVAQSDPETAPLREVRLAAVQAAKIMGSAVPGKTLTIQAKVTGRLGPLVQVQGTVETGGRRLLEARITLSGTAG